MALCRLQRLLVYAGLLQRTCHTTSRARGSIEKLSEMIHMATNVGACMECVGGLPWKKARLTLRRPAFKGYPYAEASAAVVISCN